MFYQSVERFPPADVEGEDDAVRVAVELVPDLGEEGRSGGVEDVDGDLALVHVDPGRPVVDADGRKVAGDEPLLAITLFLSEQCFITSQNIIFAILEALWTFAQHCPLCVDHTTKYEP